MAAFFIGQPTLTGVAFTGRMGCVDRVSVSTTQRLSQ